MDGTTSNLNYDNTPRYENAPPAERGKKRNTFLVFLVILIILGLLGAGFFLFKDQIFSGEEAQISPSPFMTSTPIPTPTMAEANKEELTIEVQNGSGVAGEASFLKGKLEGLGYKNIEAKNAASQNETATTVAFSGKVSSQVKSEIGDLLSELYQEVVTSPDTAGSFDVEILVGLRQGQKKTSPSPTKSAVSATKTLTPTGSATTPLVSSAVSLTPTKTPTPTP